MRPARRAHDCLGLQQNVPCRQTGILYPLQHRYHGDRTNIGAILVLCRQRHRQKAGILHIVDTGDTYLLGHPHTLARQACDDSHRGEVVGTDNCLWPAFLQHLLDEARIVWVSTAHEILLEMNSVRKQRFTIPGDSRHHS